MTKMKISILFSVCILFLLITPVTGRAMESLIFRINAGAGFTFIDLPTAMEWNENYFEDWDKVNVKVNLQCEFLEFSSLRLGAEVGYNRLYYYYVRVPWVPSALIYEATIAPVNVSALVSYSINDNFFIQAAAGPYFFEEGAVLGVKGTLGYRIPVSENMAVPISLVGDLITGEGTPSSIGITVGLEFKLKLSQSK